MKLSLLIACLAIQTTISQTIKSDYDKDNYIGFSLGSDVENAGQDLLFQVNMVSRNVEVNVGYESFKNLDFTKYSFGLGYHFPLYAYFAGNEIKTTFIPSIEPTLINRSGNWGGGLGKENEESSHLSIGLNLALQWNVNEYLAVEYCFNALPRTDLKAKYPDSVNNYTKIGNIPIVGSNFIKIVYKLQRN